MLNKKKNNKGFTLVELLVVIAIIGILAVVAVPSLFKNIEKGKVGELESDISAIRSAALSYYAENSEYPNVTSIVETDTVTNEDTHKNKILKEVESLGFPFKGSYKLSGSEPGKALLTIDLATGVQLSEDAAKKLVNDLGKILVVQTEEGVYVVDDIKAPKPSVASEPEPEPEFIINYEEILELYPGKTILGDLDDIEGDVSKITIELMDGANQ